MEKNNDFLDRIIKYLWDNKDCDNTYVQLDLEDLHKLCDMAIPILQKDPTLLRINAPLSVCGDVHGQFSDLMKFLQLGGDVSNTTYLFMGDYVDRGINSVATFTMLLCLKCKYPNSIFLLRGNHETPDISSLYGFKDECDQYFPNTDIWQQFNDVFSYLPIAAIISERIFCVHGGLSKDISKLSEIENLKRPLEVPESGPLADLLWADPKNDTQGYQESDRGTSYTFGPDVANNFLEENDFDLICRAHQVVNDGFEFPFYPKQSVVTVFSAPNYCNEFGNKGAMLMIDENLTCSFKFVDPPADTMSPDELRPVTPACRKC